MSFAVLFNHARAEDSHEINVKTSQTVPFSKVWPQVVRHVSQIELMCPKQWM